MEITLKRRFLGPMYTIGSWFFNDEYLCDTLEDKVRDLNHDGDLDDPGEGKVYGQTAIPYGRYKVILVMSPKHTRILPLILSVNSFKGIEVHRGNTPLDTEGCVLPGENKVKGQVINSTKYEMIIVERILKAILKQEEIWINIV